MPEMKTLAGHSFAGKTTTHLTWNPLDLRGPNPKNSQDA
jgi:hypothetical protein